VGGNFPTTAHKLEFVQLVSSRFGPPLTDSPIGELAMLRRTSNVDEYYKRFIALSYRDTTLSEPQQIQLFITSLGDPLCMDVALQQPSSLDDAVIFAHAYEQCNASREVAPSQLACPASRYTSQTATQRRKGGKCFKCDELFMPDHRKHCKQLFVIEVMDKDDVNDLSSTTDELTISLHALTGIQLCTSRTMALMVDVNGTQLIALLDSGSTHNFIDNTATSQACVVLATRHGLRVAVANGDKPPGAAATWRLRSTTSNFGSTATACRWAPTTWS
jgi:hypothetical protein